MIDCSDLKTECTTCTDVHEHSNTECLWYALKVFFNRVQPVIDEVEKDGYRWFIPMHIVENSNHNGYTNEPLIKSLLFIQVPNNYTKNIQQKFAGQLMFYKKMDRKTPASIPDKEMDNFILCTRIQENGRLEVINDKPDYHIGERVRVIKGVFTGLEGVIKRIKKDRKLIVSIQGVVAVATEYIPRDFLEVIK